MLRDPTMRKTLDVVKKEMGTDDDGPTGLRLNLEALHVAPGHAGPALAGQ